MGLFSTNKPKRITPREFKRARTDLFRRGFKPRNIKKISRMVGPSMSSQGGMDRGESNALMKQAKFLSKKKQTKLRGTLDKYLK